MTSRILREYIDIVAERELEERELEEIVRHDMDDETLLRVAGKGTPEAHLARAKQPPHDDDPIIHPIDYPAGGGFTLQQRGTYFFLLDPQGHPAACLDHWGRPKGKVIGPISALIVSNKYRRQSTGKIMYRALLDAGFTIESGFNHTQHSVKLYVWLASQPDIELILLDGKRQQHPVALEHGALVSDIPIYGDHDSQLVVRKR